jgi:5-methylcytosine-specific restriction endonuclease McrA
MTDKYYKTKRWLHLRKARLLLDLYRCVVPGCGQFAVVVDHIVARDAGGPDTLDNLRSLCREHDNAIKEDKAGKRRSGARLVVRGCFADGTPRDPAHPWFTGGSGGGFNQ